MNLHLICILALSLLLNGSLLMAKEIRQERLYLMSETVHLTGWDTFVLTGKPNYRQSACEEKTAKSKIGCVLPKVHFQLGSAELLKTEQEALLAALAHCTIALETGITVTGHTCPLGTDDHNHILSRERAEQVAAVLRNHGYTVSEVAAMGSQQPIPGPDLANNRRVELTLTQP